MTDTFESARFVNVRNGLALLRNFPENEDKWLILNSTGKWQSGMDFAADMFKVNSDSKTSRSLKRKRSLRRILAIVNEYGGGTVDT